MTENQKNLICRNDDLTALYQVMKFQIYKLDNEDANSSLFSALTSFAGHKNGNQSVTAIMRTNIIRSFKTVDPKMREEVQILNYDRAQLWVTLGPEIKKSGTERLCGTMFSVIL